jgi:hypothetical protein
LHGRLRFIHSLELSVKPRQSVGKISSQAVRGQTVEKMLHTFRQLSSVSDPDPMSMKRLLADAEEENPKRQRLEDDQHNMPRVEPPRIIDKQIVVSSRSGALDVSEVTTFDSEARFRIHVLRLFAEAMGRHTATFRSYRRMEASFPANRELVHAREIRWGGRHLVRNLLADDRLLSFGDLEARWDAWYWKQPHVTWTFEDIEFIQTTAIREQLLDASASLDVYIHWLRYIMEVRGRTLEIAVRDHPR